MRGACVPTLASLQASFPYAFDKFQRRSVESLLAGRSVVVSAPTGSGKTLVAEAAILAVLAAGKRAFYTTPLKALSNQKLCEFRARFGFDMVGLRTGDSSINPEARIVVQTTEILRNQLYRSAGGGDSPLADLGLFVLDEVHYLGDAERGTVWEECIIYAPREVPLLCLSATVGNPEDLQGWISAVHGPCDLVTSTYRPVPLSFCFARPGTGGSEGLMPLLNRKGDRISRALLEEEELGEEEQGGRRTRLAASEPTAVLRALLRDDLLPAIWFIFSRRRCDDAVSASGGPTSPVLVTPAERAQLSARLEALRLACPEAVRSEYEAPLLRGVAAHHAGCLPAWKVLVEECFQEQLLKLVFSTETLAAGINMPARAVVLSALSKRDSTGPRKLTVNEFMQMAGRAGRRGFDSLGTVVVAQSPFDGASGAAELALGEPEALASRFTVTYGMALNLLRNRTLGEVQSVMSASFGNYMRRQAGEVRGERLLRMQDELAALRASMTPRLLEAERSLLLMTKVRGRLTEERRALRALQVQAAEARGGPHSAAVASPGGESGEGGGDHWLLDRPLPVPVLLRVVPGGPRAAAAGAAAWGAQLPDEEEEGEGAEQEEVLSAAILSFDPLPPPEEGWELTALGADNVWYRCGLEAVVAVGEDWRLPPSLLQQAKLPGRLEWMWRAGALRVQGGRASFPAAGRISAALMGVQEGDGLPVPSEADAQAREYVAEARERIETLQRQLAALTGNAAMQKSVRKAGERLGRIRILEEETAKLGARQAARPPAGWGELQSALAVLREAGALGRAGAGDEGAHSLTRLGEAASNVRAQNELWVGSALLSGELDSLSPHALAGVVASLLSDECISRPVGVTYRPSEAAAAALEALQPHAARLQQLQAELQFDAPICLSPIFCGLVESWAAGSSWTEVCRDTALDEGDVARLLRRVGEFMGSIGDVPHLSQKLRMTAREGARLVDRPPISELGVTALG